MVILGAMLLDTELTHRADLNLALASRMGLGVVTSGLRPQKVCQLLRLHYTGRRKIHGPELSCKMATLVSPYDEDY